MVAGRTGGQGGRQSYLFLLLSYLLLALSFPQPLGWAEGQGKRVLSQEYNERRKR